MLDNKTLAEQYEAACSSSARREALRSKTVHEQLNCVGFPMVENEAIGGEFDIQDIKLGFPYQVAACPDCGKPMRVPVTQEMLDDYVVTGAMATYMRGDVPKAPPLSPPFDVDAAWEALPFWRKWIWRVANRVRSWAFHEPDVDEDDKW